MSVIVNVAAKGTAFQSSHSKWSKENDASRALNDDGKRAFSFHTKKEKNPWWMVKLDKVYPIESIRVFNIRKSELYHRARTLKIECSRDAEHWIVIHSGICYWGESISFSLRGMLFAKFVRLSLEEINYFHLSSVEIFVDIEEAERFFFKTIVSRRGDGMGERLNAMLISLCLSDAFGTQFKFNWPNDYGNDPMHAILPVHDMFSDEFVLKYHVDMDKLFQAQHIKVTKEIKQDDILEILKKHMTVICPLFSFDLFSAQTLRYMDFFDTQKAFQRIEFSTQIKQVIQMADDVDIPKKACCIHLRAGDLIYGDWRIFTTHAKKVIPIPVAKHLILSEQSLGNTVYICGQDPFVISYLCKTFNVKAFPFLDDSSYNNGQKAMYDIALMSRFSKLFGGSSGFVRLASYIGNSPLFSPTQLLSPSELYEICIDDLDKNEKNYTDMQTAFTYYYAYDCICNSKKIKNKIHCLEKAAQYDPTNARYKLILTALYVESNKMGLARKFLQNIFGNMMDSSLICSVLDGIPLNIKHKSWFFNNFRNLVDVVPEAALFLWKIAVNDKDNDSATYYQDVLLKNFPQLGQIIDFHAS